MSSFGIGGAGIKRLTSTGATVTITAPTGPTSDLEVSGGASGVSSFNTRTGAVTLSNSDVASILALFSSAGGIDMVDNSSSGVNLQESGSGNIIVNAAGATSELILETTAEPIFLLSGSGVEIVAPSSGSTWYTAANLAGLPTPPSGTAFGFTQDGFLYFYPTGGPWTGVNIVGNVNNEAVIRANPLNDLAAATGNYPMGGNTLTGVAPGAATGQPLIYDQLPTGDTAGTIGVTGTDPPVIANTGIFKTTTNSDGEIQQTVKDNSTSGLTALKGFLTAGDTQPIWEIGNPGAAFGLPGFLFGVGGSTGPDTSLLRTASGILQLSKALTMAGLTGAGTATRWVGGTPGGAPTSGSFLAGDFVITSTGQVLICIANGSPGTWVRANQRQLTTVSPGATPAINVDTTDIANFTTLNATITSMTSGLTGTPIGGQKLIVRLTDNGTPRPITWGTSFEASTTPLPTTTVANAMLSVGFMYNFTTTKWRCLAVA